VKVEHYPSTVLNLFNNRLQFLGNGHKCAEEEQHEYNPEQLIEDLHLRVRPFNIASDIGFEVFATNHCGNTEEIE